MQEIKTNPTVRHTTPLQLLEAFASTVAVLFVLLLTGVLDRPLTLLNNLFFYGIAWVFRL